MKPTLVVALGGNAISPSNETDTIDNQFLHTRATAERLVRIMSGGWESLVITHGNGPQVGNIVTRVEAARDVAPWLPLDICVADTQGGMGYMIQQCMSNALADAGIDRPVATLVTQVVVDLHDPAFGEPSKPIGPSKRLVPSPQPVRIVEAEAVRGLVASGAVLIAAGGGGVPVAETKHGLRGVEAVIDKDLTAALLATSIGAGKLVILTAVDGVYLDHGLPTARKLGRVTVNELRELAAGGAFPAGSMGPKVEAACRFVETKGAGAEAVIAELDDVEAAVAGEAGTQVVAD